MQQISLLHKKPGEKVVAKAHFVPVPKGGAIASTDKGAAPRQTFLSLKKKNLKLPVD